MSSGFEKRGEDKWLATDNAHRLLGPQPLDEPAALGRPIGEAVCELDREEIHRRRPAAALFAVAG